ncbi:HVO_A0114 family putative DNA-binding protein [Polaromonas sp. AET17H-212]|uniref:HVO_A0114 family putative DNA-binding protein n=1 Tax=Polaromonas sp. AET17H-212 TaxID=1977061 RepID=UPI003F8DAFCC
MQGKDSRTTIRESHPDSMDALAKAVGKHVPNVSRSLHTMAQYGLVKLTKHGRTVMPQVTSERVTVDFRSFYLFEYEGTSAIALPQQVCQDRNVESIHQLKGVSHERHFTGNYCSGRC